MTEETHTSRDEGFSQAQRFAEPRSYRRRRTSRCARCGASTLGVAMALVGGCALVTATALITPAWLGAAPAGPRSANIEAASPHHQRSIELLGRLITGSRSVLGVHPRETTPFSELTLWLDDEENRGIVDEGEIGVLSHSRALQTVSLYLLEEPEEETEEAGQVDPGRRFAPTRLDEEFQFVEWDEPQEQEQGREPLDLSDIGSAAFCERWRDQAEVRRRVLVTGASEMTVDVGTGASTGQQLLRISLTWASDSSDSTDRASLVLDVPMRRGRP